MKTKEISVRELPPITEKDREFKLYHEAQGRRVDLGEDIELKEKLAKKFHWKKAEKPRIRVLARSRKIILYKDYYHQYLTYTHTARPTHS
jgi:hypothetical protein